MTTNEEIQAPEGLIDELKNFQEIARYFNPSPGEIPRLRNIDIAGLEIPFRHDIGGDHVIYVDFKRRYDIPRRIAEAEKAERADIVKMLRRAEHRGGILVADVSGHRMTDAMLGATLHQAFLLGVNYELDLSGEVTTRLFEHLNTRFFRTTATNKYFTMIYGEISDRGNFRFLSAGHQPPAVFSREFGKLMQISPDRLVSFPPVGMLPTRDDPDDRTQPGLDRYKKRYEVNEINLLNAGDILLLHSDGLTDHGDGRYFPDQLERLLVSCRDEDSATVCSRLRADMLAYADPEDDVSVVVIRRTG